MNAKVKPSVDSLLRSEASLDRAFAFLAGLVVVELGWLVCRLSLELFDAGWARTGTALLTAATLAAYVWFAVETGRSASGLGKPGWLYAGWVIGAPLVAIGVGLADLDRVARLLELAPLHLKFVGLLIGISPLSLKFVLSSQLRSEIHDRTFAD
jgi:hypothetical protein